MTRHINQIYVSSLRRDPSQEQITSILRQKKPDLQAMEQQQKTTFRLSTPRSRAKPFIAIVENKIKKQQKSKLAALRRTSSPLKHGDAL